MVRLVIGLGLFKVIKVLFGAVVLTEMLCVLLLLLLTSQRMVFLHFEVPVGIGVNFISFFQTRNGYYSMGNFYKCSLDLLPETFIHEFTCVTFHPATHFC